jgi:ribonucleotide monophosphatase NagD (HAD superfamily)
LRAMGIHVSGARILTPLESTLVYLRANRMDSIYIVSSNPETRSFFESSLYREGAQFTILDSVRDMGERATIVIAQDEIFDPTTRRNALNLVIAGANIVAFHDKKLRMYGDLYDVNVGAIVEYICSTAKDAGVYATVKFVGKPHIEFYRAALECLQLTNWSRIAVGGDNPRSDLVEPNKHGAFTVYYPSKAYPEFPDNLNFTPSLTVKESLVEVIPFLKCR